MTYTEYADMMLRTSTESLKRANTSYIDALRRTAERCERDQALIDSGQNQYRDITDVIEESFSWIENEARSVRRAQERFFEAKMRCETIREIAEAVADGTATTADILAAGAVK